MYHVALRVLCGQKSAQYYINNTGLILKWSLESQPKLVFEHDWQNMCLIGDHITDVVPKLDNVIYASDRSRCLLMSQP